MPHSDTFSELGLRLRFFSGNGFTQSQPWTTNCTDSLVSEDAVDTKASTKLQFRSYFTVFGIPEDNGTGECGTLGISGPCFQRGQ
jgi:hypothetical protein